MVAALAELQRWRGYRNGGAAGGRAAPPYALITQALDFLERQSDEALPVS